MKIENKKDDRKVVIFEDIDEICDIIYRETIVEFTLFSVEVDKIIEEKNESKSVIDYIFNRLLSLKIIQIKDLSKPYYKLLDYIKTFNIGLANKYEDLFIEYINKVDGDNYE